MNVEFQCKNIDEKSADVEGEFNNDETADVFEVEKFPMYGMMILLWK